MAPFLDELAYSFVDVPIDAEHDNAIDTTAFLNAAEELTKIFEAFKSMAFDFVKSDMTGNIQKIRARQLAAPAESETLQALVDNEIQTKKHTASEGLLWLVRGLEFVCVALKNSLDNSAQELADSFRASYDGTLKPHHTFVVKVAFRTAMGACPYRKDFYERLATNPDEVVPKLTAYLAALHRIVTILKPFLNGAEVRWKK